MKTQFKFITILCILSCFGCATLQKFGGIRPPDLSIDKVNIVSAGLQEMDLVMMVRVKNNYPIGIHVPAFDYNFLIDNHVFLKGENALNQSISALSTNQVQVPVRIHFIDLYQSLSTLVNKDKATYQINGNVHFNIPVLGRLKIPFHKKGELPLLKIPKISIKGLHVQSISFASANLSLDLALDNPNGFLMMLKNFSYNFSIDGLKWADGTMKKSISFDKHSQSNISIPIKLNFFEMGTAIFNLIKKKQSLPYEFDTQIKLKTDLPFLKDVDIPIKKKGYVDLL
jgi:LEA14-like dessication related protein